MGRQADGARRKRRVLDAGEERTICRGAYLHAWLVHGREPWRYEAGEIHVVEASHQHIVRNALSDGGERRHQRRRHAVVAADDCVRRIASAHHALHGCHILRHTFATNLVNGVKQPDGSLKSLTPRQVADLLGHSTSEITELYYVKKDTARLNGITNGFEL